MRRILFPVILVLLFILCGCKPKSHESTNNKTDNKEYYIENEEISKKELHFYKHQLSQLFDTGLVNKNFNGAILIAKGGNILYENYIGYKNLKDKKDTIDKNTSFHLASTSKPFTGIAILRLAAHDSLNLDDPVTKFFSTFPYPDVTVRQLLCHRSGLPNYLYFMDDKTKWLAGKTVTNNDVLDFMVMYRPALNYRPGTRFNYCNTNFILLALIAEKVTKKPFPEYLKETIFAPLQMNHTFVHTPADSFRTIMSYRPSGAIWENDIFETTYGDKNVYSTVEDMLKWDRALYDENFISQSLLDSAFQPQSHERPSIHNYGLGWRMLNFSNGKNVIYHFGKWHGFTPAFARLIDEKAVIIILGNKYNENIYETAKKAYLVFGNYVFDPSTTNMDDESQPTGPTVMLPLVKKPVLKPEIKKTEKANKSQIKIQKKAVTSTTSKIKIPEAAKKQPVKMKSRT